MASHKRGSPCGITMVTEISPVFGMSLIALIETATITALVAGGMVAGAILSINYLLLKQRQKIDSINLALRLYEYWDGSKWPTFANFLDKLKNSKVAETDKAFNSSLDRFEEIALCSEIGALQDEHVKELFNGNLRQLRHDPVIQGYLKRLDDADSSVHTKLRRLLKKAEQWD